MGRYIRVHLCLFAVVAGVVPPAAVLSPPVDVLSRVASQVRPGLAVEPLPTVGAKTQLSPHLRGLPLKIPTRTDLDQATLAEFVGKTYGFPQDVRSTLVQQSDELRPVREEFGLPEQRVYAATPSTSSWTTSFSAFLIAAVVVAGVWWRRSRQSVLVQQKASETELTVSGGLALGQTKIAMAAFASEAAVGAEAVMVEPNAARTSVALGQPKVAVAAFAGEAAIGAAPVGVNHRLRTRSRWEHGKPPRVTFSLAISAPRCSGDGSAVARKAESNGPARPIRYDARIKTYYQSNYVYQNRKKNNLGVRLRLDRWGQTHKPFYRILAVNHKKRANKSGRFLERLGYYNPFRRLDNPDCFKIKADRVCYWLRNGGNPTEQVASLLDYVGIIRRTGDIPKWGEWEWRIPVESGPDPPEGWFWDGPQEVSWNNKPKMQKRKGSKRTKESIDRPLIEKYGFKGYTKVPIDYDAATDNIDGSSLSTSAFPNTQLPLIF